MKKLLLTSLILMFVTVSVSAQSEYGMRGGFYKSMRDTNIGFGNDGLKDGGNYNEGFYIGAFARFRLTEKFSIQPEITYTSIHNDFDQLHIPLLVGYRIGKKFTIFTGPNIMFLLTDNQNFKKLNFGINVGISYSISKRLDIDARYNWSLTEALETDFGGTVIPTIKFNGFQVGLTYRFD